MPRRHSASAFKNKSTLEQLILIDISTEKLITLAQAAEKLQVSKASITRWIIHGTHGIRLEALKFGAYWRTSEEALQRFGESHTPTNLTSFSPSTSYKSFDRESPKRLREIEKACEELDEALGIRKCEACRKELDAGRVALPKNEKLWCPKCLVLRKSVTMGQRVRTFRWDAKLSQQALNVRTRSLRTKYPSRVAAAVRSMPSSSISFIPSQ
jgi:hypothetical protein